MARLLLENGAALLLENGGALLDEEDILAGPPRVLFTLPAAAPPFALAAPLTTFILEPVQ